MAATYELGSHNVLEIGRWDKELPAGKSIRIDVPSSAWQLWSWYLLGDHPVSVTDPLGGFFPHPPVGYRGDYALEMGGVIPGDAIGPPLFHNGDFAIYRLRHRAGPDPSSRALVYDVTKITY